MKNNKINSLRLMLASALIIFTVFTAAAQNGMGQKLKDMTPQQRADYQSGLMKTKLKLDTQQMVKVRAVNIKYALKFQPIIKSDDNRFSRLKQAMALQSQKDDELKSIFTDAQFKQYKEFESEMRKKMQDKMN
jgi:anion-transporting  ArsA/GET3 family ATPase